MIRPSCLPEGPSFLPALALLSLFREELYVEPRAVAAVLDSPSTVDVTMPFQRMPPRP